MADTLTPERRSALMRRVKQRDTKPEIVVRRLLHARGHRFRLHRKDLPGTPDLVFPARRAALFVNGCFWHGHTCGLGRLPKTRPEFWSEKIDGNRRRDARKIDELVDRGWRAMTVWQCSLKDGERAAGEIEAFLDSDTAVAETSPAARRGGDE